MTSRCRELVAEAIGGARRRTCVRDRSVGRISRSAVRRRRRTDGPVTRRLYRFAPQRVSAGIRGRHHYQPDRRPPLAVGRRAHLRSRDPQELCRQLSALASERGRGPSGVESPQSATCGGEFHHLWVTPIQPRQEGIRLYAPKAKRAWRGPATRSSARPSGLRAASPPGNAPHRPRTMPPASRPGRRCGCA